MSTHAVLSPSAAERWMNCPGSVAISQGLPDRGSKYADEGTAAHALAELALTSGKPVEAYLGRLIDVNGTGWGATLEMVDAVGGYVDQVRAMSSTPGDQRFVEVPLDISWLTLETGAIGTSDAVILKADGELQVHDLKYGRGVKVEAEGNKQLKIYALAAWVQFDYLGPFTRVRTVIHQPRLGVFSEASHTLEELERFSREVASAAARVTPEAPRIPGEKQCQWCRAKAICPELRGAVVDAISDTPPAEDQALADAMGLTALAEFWIKAVRAEVEVRLKGGRPVPGYKLVEGRKGARAWGDAPEAEALLKSMRLKTEEMYSLTLISPTTAEKLHKAGTIGPRQWPKVQALITQAPGALSVAPESDKRPAVVKPPAEDVFADLV